ncbi:hypothetical protein FRC06_000522 [Ceratobasidium sp. 370]|nr:hypothetical protein FRC06_000522 [Ceratobasidium sp. 370]
MSQISHPSTPQAQDEPRPVVLVDHLAEALEPLFEEIIGNTEAIKNSPRASTNSTIAYKPLSWRLDPTQGTRATATVPRGPPHLTGDLKSNLQGIVRRTVYNGCAVDHMKDFQLGLSDGELRRRQEEDPDEPWRPDFLKSIDDPANDFWVSKILATALKDAEAQPDVASGKIPKEFWTRECLLKHILRPMWSNAHKEVKKKVDADAKARADANAKRGRQKSRQQCLLLARTQLVVGDDEHPPFKIKINNEVKTIPVELMVAEATSNVAEDAYGPDGVPDEVEYTDYLEARKQFKYEGVPPFYRCKMWNKIFKVMDERLLTRQHVMQPCYYATENRGQRAVEDARAADIPVWGLYRCHLSEYWFKQLSDHQRDMLKQSPKGWEVDEEKGDTIMTDA